MIDVVAAVIQKDNKYLIAQRNRNKHSAFHWEFPGGKVDQGETFEIALQREIKEELDLDISRNCVAPLTFTVADDEISQTILLLHVCRKWQGTPESLLGQRIEWVRPINLIQYKMPKPNSFLNAMLRDWVASP